MVEEWVYRAEGMAVMQRMLNERKEQGEGCHCQGTEHGRYKEWPPSPRTQASGRAGPTRPAVIQ